MSEVRGIEIHNGEVVFPEGMPQTLHMGTEASPLTQGVASQIVVSAVINALALGGTVIAGLFKVIASVDLTGDLKGIHAYVAVNDGITLTGTVHGALIQMEILGSGKSTHNFYGLHIQMSTAVGAETEGAINGLYIMNYLVGTVAAAYDMVRLQENGSARIESFLFCRCGTGGVDYFFKLFPNTDAWNATGYPADQSGWVRVMVGGLVRYINLYATAP